MKVITDAMVRKLFFEENQKNITIHEGSILTQGAKEFIKDKKIELGFNSVKGEEQTHLYRAELVEKTNPIIAFRGELDFLQSEVILLQCIFNKKETIFMVEKLEEILELLRHIMRSEVKKEPFLFTGLFGYSEAQLREISHNPQKYFKKPHMTVGYQMGIEVAGLNRLRTLARKCEISCNHAFGKGNHPREKELLKALNRLSSGIYILMYLLEKGGAL